MVLSQALDETVRVRLTTWENPHQGDRIARPGVDFDMPDHVLIPAGQTKVFFTVRTTAPDYTTTGHSAAEVRLAALPAGECFPYSVTEGGFQVVVRDSSREIPEDCKTKVDISVDRTGFEMAEGETVNYRIFLSGPTPTVFPIVIRWAYANPDGYRIGVNSLDKSHPHTEEVVYTEADWNRRQGKPLSLKVTDPDDAVDGDGKIMVAHHLVYNGAESDPNYTSVFCLQGPQALKMTQMLVKVTDVPAVSGQQKSGSGGTDGEQGRIKRPEVKEIPQEPVEEPEPQKEGEEPVEDIPETTTTTTQPPPTTTTTTQPPPTTTTTTQPPPTTTTTTQPPPTTTTTRPKLQKRDCSGLKAAFDAEVAAYKAVASPTNWPDSAPMHAAQAAWRACLAGR